MTILLASVSPQAAYLSQDSVISAYFPGKISQILKENPIQQAPNACPQPVQAAGTVPQPQTTFGSKIRLIPHLSMAMGMSGDYIFAGSWAGLLGALPYFTDVVDVDRIAPELFRAISSSRGLLAPTVIIHAGWSRREGRARGFMYVSDNGFQSVELDSVNAVGPAPHPDYPEYQRITDLWPGAEQGHNVEAFHVALAQNIEQQYFAGGLHPLTHVGGELHSVRIDQHGMSLFTSHRFTGYGDAIDAIERGDHSSSVAETVKALTASHARLARLNA